MPANAVSTLIRRFFGGSKRLAATALYGMSNFLPRMMNSGLKLSFVAAFSVGQYGRFGIMVVLISLLGILLDLGVPQAVLRDYYDRLGDQDATRAYLQSMLLGASAICIAMLPPIGIAFYYTAPLLHVPQTGILKFTLLILAIAFIDRAVGILSIIFVAAEQPGRYAAGPTTGALAAILAGVVFVFVWHKGVPGAMFALLAGRLVTLAVYLTLFRRHYGVARMHIDWRSVSRGLHYGLPLVPTRLAFWGREAGLRPALASFANLAAAGLFSFASSIASLPLMVTSAVDQLLAPHYFKRRTQDTPGFIARVRGFREVYLAMLMPLWAGAILFCREAILLVGGARYALAVPICMALLCASFVRVQQPNHTRQVNYLRKTWINPLVTVPSAVLSLTLALLIARYYNIAYAGWAVWIAEILLYLAYAACLRLIEPVQEPVTLVVGHALFLAALAAWLTTFGAHSNVMQLAVKLCVLLVIVGTSFLRWIWPNRVFIQAILRG